MNSRKLIVAALKAHFEAKPSTEDGAGGGINFGSRDHNLFFRLTEAAARAFRDCIEQHMVAFGRSSLWSKAALEKVVQGAYYEAAGALRADEAVGRRALDAAASAAARKIRAAPRTWGTCHPVYNIVLPKRGPVQFGAVSFQRATKRTLKDRARAALPRDHDPYAEWWIDRLPLKPFAIAETAVVAHDAGAADMLGRSIVTEALDVLNFYGRFKSSIPAWASPLPVSNDVDWYFVHVAGQHLHRGSRFVGVDPLEVPEVGSDAWQQLRMGIISDLLRKSRRAHMEQGLLAGIAWGGRAVAEAREDRRFLFNAIALESVVAPGAGRTAGLTDTIISRTCALVAAEVPRCRKQVDALYKIRSAIVHAGRTDVALVDADAMAGIARRAVFRVLSEDKLRGATQEAAEDWFREHGS